MTCVENSDGQKVKPGVATCDGCHRLFCLPHFSQHRDKLNEKLDEIAGQRNLLLSRLEQLPTRITNEYIKTVNDWKKAIVQTMNEAAENAEKQVNQHVLNEVQQEFDQLSTKINSLRSDDNCVETDLEQLQTTINKLNDELSDSKSLHRVELNLPNLNCSNIVQIKLVKEQLPTVKKDLTLLPSNDIKEYSSFIENFIKTNKPFTDLTLTNMRPGRSCVSPTMQIRIKSNGTKSNSIKMNSIERLVFDGQSKCTFNWTHGGVIDIRWSSSLQQFIVLTASKIVVIDALEKEDEVVVDTSDLKFKCISHWKALCIVSDNINRLFMYEMKKNMENWLLLYCWSKPTTCLANEDITCIGLNDEHIILGIQNKDQYRFTVHTRLMILCSTIQLDHPCTTIQAMLNNEWLISNSSKQYYVIDSKQNKHAELYLTQWKDCEVFINCDQPSRFLFVLLSRVETERAMPYVWNSTKKRIEIYISNIQ